MKPLTVKIIKQGLLISGIALFLVASITKTFTIQFTGLFGADAFRKELVGYLCPTWYLCVSVSTILFFLGYFKNTLPFKILFYIFLPVFLFLVGLAIRADINMYSEYNNNEFHIGYYLTLIGTLVIFLATIISLHRPIPQKTNSQLLDSEV